MAHGVHVMQDLEIINILGTGKRAQDNGLVKTSRTGRNCLVGRRILMNDFTKEELEILITAMNRVIEFTSIWDEPKHFNVISKLQSLIDNYPIHLDVSELEKQTR